MNQEQQSFAASRYSSDGGAKEGIDDFVFLVPSSVYMAAKRKRFGEQNRAASAIEGNNKSALIIDSISKQLRLLEPNIRLQTEIFQAPVSPLFISIEIDELEIANELVQLGANVNEKISLTGLQGNCWSLLHYVCSYESKFDAAKLLIARGAEINMQDRYGQTPLHVASFRGHKNLVLLLVSLNADVNIRDQFGEEAVDKMLRGNHPELTELLLTRGGCVHLQPYEAHIDRALTYNYTLRMMLVGDSAVGKTALISRATSASSLAARPPPVTTTTATINATSTVNVASGSASAVNSAIVNPSPTHICNTTVHKFSHENVNFEVEIVDFSGKLRYNNLLPLYYQNAHVVLVVFDLTRRDSWVRAKHRVAELSSSLPPSALIGLLGNKVDLISRRVVSLEEATAFAQDCGLQYMETSATAPDPMHKSSDSSASPSSSPSVKQGGGLAERGEAAAEVTWCTPTQTFIVFLQMYHSQIGRFPAPCAPTAVVLKQRCRIIDLHFGRRLDYTHTLPAQWLGANPFHSGWLTKKGHWVQNWRERFFVLKDLYLYYYETEQDEHPRGIVSLRHCKVRDCTERPFAFEIVTEPSPLSSSHDVYSLAATNEKTKEGWMNAVEAAKQYAEQLRARDPQVRKWLPSLRHVLPAERYTDVPFSVTVQGNAFLFQSLDLSQAETITPTVSFHAGSLRVLRVLGSAKELLICDNLGLRFLLADASDAGGLFTYLQTALPPSTSYGNMTHDDFFLNMQLSYFLSSQRMTYPVLKLLLDELHMHAKAPIVNKSPSPADRSSGAASAVPPLLSLVSPRNSRTGSGGAPRVEPPRSEHEMPKLSLNHVHFKPQDMDAIMQALSFYPYCVAMELHEADFTEPSFSILVEELIDNPFIHSLDLSYCMCKFNIAPALSTLVQKKRTLTSLNLFATNMSPKALEQLTRALRPNKTLLSLNLGKNRFDDRCAGSIASLLRDNTSIEKLILRENFFSSAAEKTLLPALKQNSCVQHIDLDGNVFSQSFLQQCQAHAAGNRATLDLRASRRKSADLSGSV